MLPLPAPRLEAHLYWHESVENDPANRWLREQIEDVLAWTAGVGKLNAKPMESDAARHLDARRR